MRLARYLLAFLLVSLPAAAQFTQVSGTVTDPNGIPYANGTIAPILVNVNGGSSVTLNGQAYTPPVQPAGLDKTGAFVMNLAANASLLPAGTEWNFWVCSAVGTVNPSIGTGSQCFTLAAPITIAGATQSISAQLQAAAIALTLPSSGGLAAGNNSELQRNNAGAFGGAGVFAVVPSSGVLSFNRNPLTGICSSNSVAAWDFVGISPTAESFRLWNSSCSFLNTMLTFNGQTANVQGVFNNTLYVGSPIYPCTNTGLHGALAVANANGGKVVVPPGCIISVTSQVSVGTATTPVVLYIEKSGQLIINVPGGVPAILLFDASKLQCDSTTRTPHLLMGASANITDLVAPGVLDGTQESLFIENCYAFDPSGNTGTITGGVFHVAAVASNTYVRNTVADAFPVPLFEVGNITTAGTSDVLLDNNWGNCEGITGCIPLQIQGQRGAGGGTVADITIRNGTYEHGPANSPQIDLEGNSVGPGAANTNLFSIAMIGKIHVENLAGVSGNIGVKIVDAHDISLSGIDTSGLGSNGTVVSWNQANTGTVFGISLQNITNQAITQWPTTWNDLIDSVSDTVSVSIANKCYKCTNQPNTPVAFSTLPTCAANFEGMVASVSDSTTATWGATITGGSTNHVLAYCDGSHWTVAGM